MPTQSDTARSRFVRMMLVIASIGVLMVIGALYYLSLYEPLTIHMIVATIGGVFLSVVLGSGLFAAAFFSDRSGHDQTVTDATMRRDPE